MRYEGSWGRWRQLRKMEAAEEDGGSKQAAKTMKTIRSYKGWRRKHGRRYGFESGRGQRQQFSTKIGWYWVDPEIVGDLSPLSPIVAPPLDASNCGRCRFIGSHGRYIKVVNSCRLRRQQAAVEGESSTWYRKHPSECRTTTAAAAVAAAAAGVEGAAKSTTV